MQPFEQKKEVLPQRIQDIGLNAHVKGNLEPKQLFCK